MAERTCTMPECGKLHRARGLCATHYNQARYTSEQRHPKIVVECANCGVPCEKFKHTPYANRFCSFACRDMYGKPSWSAYISCPLPWEHPARLDWSRQEWSAWRVYFHDCAWCGELFASPQPSARRCSRRCIRRAGRASRKALERGASGSYTWAEVMRIFVSLDRRCAYCNETVEGQPDPDHVLALSRGGSNSITNIVPSCRPCNTDKSDMTLTEWAARRQSLGLPARSDLARLTHLVISEPTRGRRASHTVTIAA